LEFADREGNTQFTALEWARGGDLFQLVKQAPQGRLPEATARVVFSQLLSALRFLHSHRVAHLDLKPENVVLDFEPTANTNARRLTAKLVDFGMAKQFAALSAQSQTQSESAAPFWKPSVWIGTLRYMAPEMYNLQTVNPFAADIYSLGVLLFVLLTGLPPYNKPTVIDPWFSTIWSTFRPLHVAGRVAGAPVDFAPPVDRTRGLRRWLVSYQLTDVVSHEAVDLLSHILCPESMRWSIDQIRAHPWLRSVDDDGSDGKMETQGDCEMTKPQSAVECPRSCAAESAHPLARVPERSGSEFEGLGLVVGA